MKMSKESLKKPNSEGYLKDNVNILIRQVGRYFQTHQNKECCYIYYWFLLDLMWNMEQLQKIAQRHIVEDQRQMLQSQVKNIEEETHADMMHKIREVESRFQDKISDMEENHRTAKSRLAELEQEAALKEEEHRKKMADVATSEVMEGLERTYGKVREALNQTYDNQMQY